MIVFTKELYEHTRNYIEFVRNRLDGIQHLGTVFVSWNGNEMDPSLVGNQLASFWNKSLGKTGRSINATIIRKFTTTKVLDNVPHLGKQTHQHLCHSAITANDNYFLYDKQKNAPNASRVIQESQRLFNDGPDSGDEFQEAIDSFEKEIRKNKKITMQMVREKLLIINSNCNAKKVLDTLRYRSKKCTSSSTTTAPLSTITAPSSTITAPSNSPEDAGAELEHSHSESEVSTVPQEVYNPDSYERTRQNFTDSDNKKIRLHLKCYIRSSKSIVAKDFTDFVNGIAELNDIVKRFGVRKLIVKIRTERKRI